MKKWMLLTAFIALTCTGFAQKIPAYNADALVQRISNPDTIYIVGFWATWCGPCVKELPEFDELHKSYAGKPVKVLLVSLDFKEDTDKKLPNFIKRKKLLPEVVWFNETDANSFIPKIDNTWQGSIPATMIVSKANEYQSFFEGNVTARQISLLVDKQLALKN